MIGTGSSGIQSIPEISRQAEHLTVFQRTPNFSVPARNQPLDPQEWAQIKADYPRIREIARQTPTGLPFPPSTASALETDPAEQRKVMEEHWTLGGFRLGQCFSDLAISKEANDVVAQYIRERIDEIVEDPQVGLVLVMEYIEGVTLEKLVQAADRPSPPAWTTCRPTPRRRTVSSCRSRRTWPCRCAARTACCSARCAGSRGGKGSRRSARRPGRPRRGARRTSFLLRRSASPPGRENPKLKP